MRRASHRRRLMPGRLQRQQEAAKKEKEGAEGAAAAAAPAPFKPSSPPKKGHYGMLGTTISGGRAPGRCCLAAAAHPSQPLPRR